MNNKLIATLMAAAALGVATPAMADEGEVGEIYWNPTEEQLVGIIQRGDTACDGSAWQNVCYTYFRVVGEVTMHTTSRQRRGSGTNFGTIRYVRATDEGYVMRGEDGSIITTLSKTTAVENGAARMYAVFASAFNGIGGAAVSGIICTINGCGSGGGSSQTAISISGSEATQVLQAAIAGGAGCTTGACGSTPTPVQSGQTAD